MCSWIDILQWKEIKRKIRMIFYIENSLWKSNFGTFWHLPINPILIFFPLSMLILREKSFQFCTTSKKTPQLIMPYYPSAHAQNIYNGAKSFLKEHFYFHALNLYESISFWNWTMMLFTCESGCLIQIRLRLPVQKLF